MATEEQKKKNLFRMMSMMIAGMAKSLYELFGDTAFATMTEVGKELLEIMENEMGLEIAGETPKDVLTEIGRIFADEYGFIASFKVEGDDHELRLIVDKCQGWNLTQKILKTGVEIPFTCPIMNVGHAALARMGKSAHRKIEPRPEVRGSTITFTFEN
ncbi:hypothetical protein QUF75_05470 [Desulfococcaceae bacterium HSG7]|nr:hypothetical protein [Desulfococcaceae bacterium HSG9]MDM8554161.1 hypothetical protein [Desulfococcaceae bacterium HSG7]